MKKDTTILEALAMGANIYDLLGVDKETKLLKRVSGIEYDIAQPQPEIDEYDYMLYEQYMVKHNGVPSVEDYMIAIEYYTNKNKGE